jgi:hypothetical protein
VDEKVFARIRDWVEPAHPAVVKQFEDLIQIYRALRERFQKPIDQAFDRVSREIGFVVTTTIPATLEIPEAGKKVSWTVSEALKGSMFEKALSEVLGPQPDPWKGVTAGKYRLYLIWHDALRLKLRKDWLEPAHYLRPEILRQAALATPAVQVNWEVREPAHWFHPAATIPIEDQIVIAAIDEVYGDLRLAERIAQTRMMLRCVRPEVLEPAHVRPEVMEPAHVAVGPQAGLAIQEIAQLIRRVRPEVVEPAHFRPFERDLLAEIDAVIRKYRT